MDHRDMHAIPESRLDEVLASRWVYPWVLSDAQRLSMPVPYKHRSGAVTFVKLEPSVSEAIARQRHSSAEPVQAHSPRDPAPSSGASQLSPAAVASAAATAVAPKSPLARKEVQTYCFRPEAAQAYGRPHSSGGFLVEAGSTAMRDGSPKVKRDRDVRDQLVRAGVLAPDRDPRLYRFSADYVFASASQAAGVVKDGNASGRGLWIDVTTGKSLRDQS
jgi:hypothetical protein